MVPPDGRHPMTGLVVSGLALVAWIYLLLFRGQFWLTRETDKAAPVFEGPWPSVAAIVPARDEAETIGASIGSLLAQDYPGTVRVLLVDDQSSDGTASRAALLDNGRLEILRG